MDDLISVVMPAYNCEKYIEEAINSVLSQTYKNFELIVIDDGSTDETITKLTLLAKKDSRIKLLINGKNIGVAATRNKAVTLAKGEWIAFLDSDDWWQDNKLEKQIKHRDLTQGDFIFTGSSFIDCNGNSLRGIFEVPERVSYKDLLKQNVISCSSVLVKKKYIEEYPMEKDDIHEDFASWLQILKAGNIAYGLNEALLVYRISSNSKSGNKIKSLRMAYKTYRSLDVSIIKSLYYMSWYICKGIKKYKGIHIHTNTKKEAINRTSI